jgi:hypothetical protein
MQNTAIAISARSSRDSFRIRSWTSCISAACSASGGPPDAATSLPSADRRLMFGGTDRAGNERPGGGEPADLEDQVERRRSEHAPVL